MITIAVEAVAGDTLTVDTQLPGSGTGQFVNDLDRGGRVVRPEWATGCK